MPRSGVSAYCFGMGGSPRLRGPIVGRQEHLDELRAAISDVRNGRGCLLLLSGEPGIGKTRLAEEAEPMALAASLRVLWGRCHEIEGRPPFWPWVQIVGAYVREVGAAALAADFDADLQPFGQLVPELHPHLSASAPEAGTLEFESARFRLFQSLATLLRRIAASQPLLLVLDDLHWADLPSLRLLEFLAYDLTEVPIVVVGTYRDVDVRRTANVAEIVDRLLRRARLIELVGLTVDEIRHFVAASTAERVDDSVAARLYEVTDGNPLFLDEMVRLLRARGGWPSLPGGWPLPRSVVAIIRQRLEWLPAETCRLLSVSAVAGRDFDLVTLAAMLQEPRTALLERLGPAVELGIVTAVAARPGRFRFVHALFRDAIHEALAEGERGHLHRRYGEALEARHAASLQEVLPQLAYHFCEAAMHGGETKALGYSERAGSQAMGALAYEEAAEQFSRALNLLELEADIDRAHQCELLIQLGDATNRAAQGLESVQAYQRAATLARDIGSPAQLARAAIGLCGVGSTWAEYGRYDAALVAVLREALDALPPGELGLRARVMARLAAELHWAATPVDDQALSIEAVELARRGGDVSTLAYTLSARLRCSNPDHREERLSIIDEILALTGSRGDLAVHALVWRLSEALQAGVMEDVEACRAILIRAVNELRQARDLWLIPVLESQKLLLEGSLQDAERAAEAMLGQKGLSANAQMTALALLFLIRREQGRHGELADGLRGFAYQSTTVSPWRAALAQVYAETGTEAEARAEIDAIVGEDLSSVRRDNTWTLTVAGLAGAAAIVGRPEQAATIYRALQPYDGRNVVVASFFYFGPVSYYLGILAARQGLRGVALAHLDSALATARALGARTFVARILQARERTMEMEPQTDSGAGQAPRHNAAASTGVGDCIPAAPAPVERIAALRHQGSAWMLEYQGRTAALKARRGMEYLARLLAEPGRELHVLDLAVDGKAGFADNAAPEPLLDARTKRELRDRLDDMRATLEEAEANNDLGRAEQARAEIEAISEHLAHAVGMGGRDRRVRATSERARAAVTKALRTAIRQIEDCEPSLGALLTRTIRTGTFCCYTPLREAPIVWTIQMKGR